MNEDRERLRELRKQMGLYREFRVCKWERPTSQEAQLEVASFLGRVQIGWWIEEREKRREMGL